MTYVDAHRISGPLCCLMKKHGRICGRHCLGPMYFLSEQEGQRSLASDTTLSSTNGLHFLCRPVKVNEKVLIRIEGRASHGSLSIGFTNTCPRTMSFTPTTLRHSLQCCVVPVPAELCLPGAKIKFWMNYAPSVMIRGMDGKKYFMKAEGLHVHEPLYVFLDVCERASIVRLLGSTKGKRTSCSVSPDQSYTTKEKANEENLLNYSLIADMSVHSDQQVFRGSSTRQTSLASSPVSTPGSEPSTNRQASGGRLLNINPQCSMEEMDVTTLLRAFQQQYISTNMLHVIICRKKLLESAIIALSNNSFSWTKTPQIEFAGEEAFDNGGPRREFFRLLMFEVQSILGIFEGKPDHLFFTYDQRALQQRRYEEAGKLVAWSIIHGGPGLKSLDPCLYQLMCGVETDLKDFDCCLIPDTKFQIKAKKILSCRKNAQFYSLQSTLGDWISDCGFPGIYGPNVSIRDIPRIYSYVVRHYIYLRVSSMTDQFIKGLNSYGRLWDTVKANWIDFMPIFTNMSQHISQASFKALFQICWSREGTKRRVEEEQTIYHWELLLKMIEDKKTVLSFKELLVFITASDEMPVLGFPPKLSINFYPPEKKGWRLPYTSNCMMGLFLPRGVRNSAELNMMLLISVRESMWFGKS